MTCVNCHCDVTVSHTEKNRLFVCPGLLVSVIIVSYRTPSISCVQATEEDIAQVKSHPHYSRVFRISLNPDLEDEPVISWPRGNTTNHFDNKCVCVCARTHAHVCDVMLVIT